MAKTFSINPGEELTREAIEAIMADSSTRGGYKTTASDFLKSGALYLDLMTLDDYKGKTATAVKQSMDLNLKKDESFATLKCVRKVLVDSETGTEHEAVLLINPAGK